jgi:hypothetical protein
MLITINYYINKSLNIVQRCVVSHFLPSAERLKARHLATYYVGTADKKKDVFESSS